ncbi:MAG: GMC family oxidoreductase [Actinomycetota bacterium]|nr:GMC family oxidoreductase [Actinomycetota bacterium]
MSDEREPEEYDWIVVGSGFGGSVSALRLAEKGYSVGVIECGRRYEDSDFAKSTWRLNRYYWLPRLGMRGIFRLSIFKDILIVSGSGVGGGSLGYANTLYRARPAFFIHPQWDGLAEDWRRELDPHYETAEHMLGVTRYEGRGPADDLLFRYAEDSQVEETWTNTRVGVFFGPEGEEVPDPYFGGEGPPRTGCVRCGQCMIGCRYNAKNTLRKNYLWFAERLGVKIHADRQVVGIRPLGAKDGSAGYELATERAGSILRKRRRTFRARGVVLAAGALGTNKLLRDAQHTGTLPRLSDRLGHLVRTNSESIMAVTAPDSSRDFARSIAITSSIYPDPDTHVEVVTYGKGGDSISSLFTLMTGEGTRLTRPTLWLRQVVRHPRTFARTLWPRKWSERTVILLVMQSLDNAMRLIPRRKLFGRGIRLQTEQDPDRPNPSFIPEANRVAEWFAKELDGIPQSGLTESLSNKPTTAHILGGAVIGSGPDTGVIDPEHRVFGYEDLLVCDGSAVPANPGVNPSLTITAMAERAMERIPPRASSEAKSAQGTATTSLAATDQIG